ncbi:hypothetical protein CHH55_09120 [Niallia circulans]|uniref:Uncharacterized protein n=1 Tax=Niallia circulans TaxID=1397 RepID=A0A0J1LEU6_NIACI|nr:hypothetical protein ABW02_04605 [Niallia circulans]PAD25627.1 hypothetical protein CHH62_09960 [Niallia circulans]PAD88434.1 hypothetical protein CHH55_09120 [Niallia circulans]PAE12593.1 hypothetical protein CHI02_08610 [Niallia circulans]
MRINNLLVLTFRVVASKIFFGLLKKRNELKFAKYSAPLLLESKWSAFYFLVKKVNSNRFIPL